MTWEWGFTFELPLKAKEETQNQLLWKAKNRLGQKELGSIDKFGRRTVEILFRSSANAKQYPR